MIRDQRERAANPSDDVEYPGPFGSAAAASAKFFRRARRFLGGHEPSGSDGAPRTVPMRIEPKTFFANERTFLSWLHGCAHRHHRRRTRVDSSREERGDASRRRERRGWSAGARGAGLLGASQREGDGGRAS